MGKDQELLEAARNGTVPVVEKILAQRAKRSGPLASLRRGPGANVQDSSGYSCLHHAALNGHSEVVRLLLEHDASTNIVDCRGSSPLHLAAWTGNVDIVRQLLSGPIITNVNLTTKDSETALHSAAQYGHTAVVEQLLDNACDPAIRNIRGETALDLAAQYGRLDTVELLLHRHRELILPMRRAVPGILFPHTPLHLASRNGHKGVVEALLAAGFDVNIRTAAGTALTEAAICGKVEVVRTLLDHGADLSVRDAHGNTVMDLLAQFPAQATQEITSVIRRYFRSNGSLMGDSDIDECLSLSQPFPPVPEGENSLGSPYENVRPTSRGRSLTAESVSPSTSPSRWDYYRQSRSVDMCEERDRRVSGASAMSITRKHRIYKSMPIRLKPRSKKRSVPLPTITISNNNKNRTRSPTVLDSVTFSFSQQCTLLDLRVPSEGSSSTSSYKTTSPNSFRGSDNSVYQTPPAPKSFMDCSVHSEDLSFSLFPEADQVSLSSTASSCGYRDRRLDSGSAPLYLPMNRGSGLSGHSGHSPSSNSKVSPTPPKKPPRRNLSVSPTHLQPMSVSAEGVGNPAYEYLYLARSGARSQSDLDEIDGGKSDTERRREPHHHLRHGRSVDAYVEMNCVFSLGADEIDEPLPVSRELQRGKSEDLDSRRPRDEPVAISAMYENTIIKTQNPRRKLRRHHDRADTTYEQYDFRQSDSSPVTMTSSSAPDTNYVSSAFLTIKSSQENLPGSVGVGDNCSAERKVVKLIHIPMSPTHYQQPPTPDHPPPSAVQAEKSIHERIRPLSQEYKRRSKDMETETEEEYLIFPCDESSGSLSSSISLSDKSVSTDNNVEEFVGDVPFAGLLKGSTKVLDNLSTPRPIPAERPKTLRKLKHVYENANGGGMAKSEDLEVVTQRKTFSRSNTCSSSSSASGTVVCAANGDKDKSLSILSPFDEQEEWAKIQEIMASFGTGLVRESVFVSELEKEFQTRLMSLSQSHMAQASNASTVEKWLSNLGMTEYESLFMSSGFDDLDFLNGVLENSDLSEMGITSDAERKLIMDAARQLPAKVQEQAPCNNNNIDEAADTVDQWLRRIHLDCYTETFSKHLYLDMERIRRIWDVELSAVLDIDKIGHRKRILASVSGGDHITPGPKLEDINADLNMLNTNIQQLKEDIKSSSPATQQSSTTSSSNGTANNTTNTNTNTGTLRHRHKKSRPAPPPPVQVPGSNGAVHNKPEKPEKPKSEAIEIRAPSELRLGAGTPLRAQWRHKPLLLITGAVQYIANYLGSTVIKELRGMESTRKSIQKLKKTSTNVKPTPEIILSISYRGVKFLNTITQKLVCEHEIRNIQCVCQDPDDLTHFAYITKDHATKKHYCHVFSSPTTDQATEVILTLGQAFEVAYQMALREQVTSRSKKNSQAYNHPARSPGSVSSKSKDCGKESPPSSRARSHSASDIKLNGHQLKMTPMSLSTEPFGNDQPSERTPTKGHLSFASEDAKVTETAV